MDTDIRVTVALVAGLLGLLGTLVSLFVSFYQDRHRSRLAEGLEQLREQIQTRRDKRTELVDKEKLTSTYRDPLLHAAYDLQSRIFNIVREGFLHGYYVKGDARQQQYAVENTVFVLAQFLGWTEVVRQELRFITLEAESETQQLRHLQDQFYSILRSDKLGDKFIVFAGDQRAIGELMIAPDSQPARVIGYATFLTTRPQALDQWLNPLRADIADMATNLAPYQPRLIALQHSLVSLLELLDPNAVYFPARNRSRL
jgi:hypothetical protein